jgi:hypothetical protein
MNPVGPASPSAIGGGQAVLTTAHMGYPSQMNTTVWQHELAAVQHDGSARPRSNQLGDTDVRTPYRSLPGGGPLPTLWRAGRPL